MAFDFPSSPAVGDTFEEGGVKYTWSGTAWDLFTTATANEFVLKAGDVMTGPLGFSTADFNISANVNMDFNGLAAKEYKFYIDALEQARINEDGLAVQGHVRAQGGGQFAFSNTDNNAWQNVLSCNGGFWLQYHQGGNNDGRMRMFTSNGGYSDAWVMETTIVSGSPGINVNGQCEAGSLRSRGGATLVSGIHVSNGNTVAPSQNDCRGHIKMWHNTADAAKGFGLNITSGRLNYTTDSATNMHCFMCGTTQAYVIDNVGAVGNSFRATAPEALAIGVELGLAPEVTDAGIGKTRDGVDIVKAMALLLAKVRLLEGEIATLKKARR